MNYFTRIILILCLSFLDSCQSNLFSNKILPPFWRKHEEQKLTTTQHNPKVCNENTIEEDFIKDDEIKNVHNKFKYLLSQNGHRKDYQLDGMELIAKGELTKGSTWSLYGTEDPVTGLLQIQLVAHFKVSFHDMKKCLLDEIYQKSYDKLILVKKVVQVRNNGSSSRQTQVIYHKSKFPIPMKNRDYLYFRRIVNEDSQCMYIQRDVPTPEASRLKPEEKGTIRAGNGDYWSHGFLQEEKEVDGRGSCLVIIHSQDNIQGGIPLKMQNAFAKKGAAGYLQTLEHAAIKLSSTS